jgi:hypothetical protein
MGNMIEADEEPSPPYYGRYGERRQRPLYLSRRAARNQGGYTGNSTGSFGANDARLEARNARAFFDRYPDAKRIG